MHRVVYAKSVEECEEISCIALSSSMSSFRKIQIIEFAYSASCLGYRAEESDCCDTVCSGLFISFRFAKYSKPVLVHRTLPVRIP